LVSRYESTAESIGDVDAIVSVGGDNYSFDYGRPSRFWALNDFWRQRGVPVFVWGASVGPFPHGADEHVAASSLRGVSRIFARELDTVSYLDSIGVSENVSVSADPAFTLEPETCDEVNLAGELGSCVGLNLSPLFGRYTGLGPDEWLEASVQCVLRMGEVTGRRIVLVPHVMLEGQSDEAFLWRIAERVGSSVDLAVLPGHLSARQLKACIARFSVFVGARTHATIAALSSLVPTVTLAYSTKAYGINREIFGHTDYVMSAAEFDPNRLALMATAMLDDKEAVRALEERVPPLVQRARESAATLAGVLGVSVGSGA
jgi:polysaccharide pyruvyl transferase WcaK-like protein